MLEAITKEIDGVSYSSTKIPAMRATKLQNRIVKVLGPSAVRIAGAIVSALGKGNSVEQFEIDRVDFEAIGAAVSDGFGHLDDSATEGLLREILCSTSYVDEKGNPRPLFPTSGTAEFDRHFTGDLPHMWRVVGFSLGVNFGGFFDMVTALVSKGREFMLARSVTAAGVERSTSGNETPS